MTPRPLPTPLPRWLLAASDEVFAGMCSSRKTLPAHKVEVQPVNGPVPLSSRKRSLLFESSLSSTMAPGRSLSGNCADAAAWPIVTGRPTSGTFGGPKTCQC
eukprot:CAMPEP_0178373208 /NCGR_PEP_ID=MMETSP0689_2-20121128/1746_1 /TAXON_ID=160604 /ORGANISM="Amphidinium massartii, Strain CS-259" /LENGTH=101 /DNA_ID=CAMNT_0019993147 /DNA_START=1138 /DNA_END=1443 /DNA_ORIENTATION=-